MQASQKGVTLIELIMIIAILAVLITTAIPSFNRQVQDVRMRTTVNKIKQSMEYARAKAIHLRSRVIVLAKGNPRSPNGGNPAYVDVNSWEVYDRNSQETFVEQTDTPGSLSVFLIGNESVQIAQGFEYGPDGLLSGYVDQIFENVNLSIINTNFGNGWKIRVCKDMGTDGKELNVTAIGTISVSDYNRCNPVN